MSLFSTFPSKTIDYSGAPLGYIIEVSDVGKVSDFLKREVGKGISDSSVSSDRFVKSLRMNISDYVSVSDFIAKCFEAFP